MDEHPLRAYAPLRILIVDDDVFLAELAGEHYRSHGHVVEHAADGAQALQSMARQLPDIVLCDRRMPEMSGAELLEAVRAQGEKWAQVVFVFVTGLSDRRDRYSMLALKPDDYFCKPIDFPEADRKLAAILRRRRGTPAA